MKRIETEAEYVEAKQQAEAMAHYLAELQSNAPITPQMPQRLTEPKWRNLYSNGTQEQLNELNEEICLYEIHRQWNKG